MTTESRSLRSFRSPIGCLILLAALGAAAGCSTAESPGGSGTNMNHVLPSGSSVAGWLVVPSGGSHTSTATLDYIANGGISGCAQCHGSDLSGGISNVSCFSDTATGCHHVTGAGAPVWSNPLAHGAAAKKAPGSSGFASCQICHGRDFSGGGTGIACADCHGPAHPLPWRVANGSTFDHNTTNTANAPVCFGCHADSPAGNPNNPHRPPTPAAAGTPPGCFNGTMCHNQPGAPHPVGAAWVTPPPAAQPHGNDAKAAPAGATGFAYCQDCHGTGTTPPANFGGGSSGVDCYLCHGVSAPHAPAPWRTSAGSTYNHTSADPANAPVCQQCHFPGSPNNPAGHPPTPAPAGTAPGCFNSTLCHGQVGAPHPVPFNDASHYSVTSATFPGSCSSCHDVSAPSTKSGPVCQTCHVAASPLTAVNCTSCHAVPPDGGAPAGAAYPNIAGAHSTHIALTSAGTPISCDTCHDGLGPSLQNLNHYNRAKARVAPGDAALLATYNAQTVPFSFDNTALSCSNVSCHGGQATPDWRTGALDVNNQCTNCHVSGTTQFNSYVSGRHTLHVNLFGATAATCALCHNTTTLAANHFTALSTPAMEGPASATIGGTGTGILAGNYVAETKSCTPACHGTETW